MTTEVDYRLIEALDNANEAQVDAVWGIVKYKLESIARSLQCVRF